MSSSVKLLYNPPTPCWLLKKQNAHKLWALLYSVTHIRLQTLSLQLLLLSLYGDINDLRELHGPQIPKWSARFTPLVQEQARSPTVGSFFFTFPPWNKWSIWQAAKRRTAPCSWRGQIWGFPWMYGGSGWKVDPDPQGPAASSACDQVESGVPCSHLDPFCKHMLKFKTEYKSAKYNILS